MAMIMKDDFLKVNSGYNELLSEIAALVGVAATMGFNAVDSQILLEVCTKHLVKLSRITQQLTGKYE